ncbi:hypothetical protein ABZZ74_52950 [Streptomyces sp. NPDC006476]|uniref:hypothetical protein n=1 Tax=Streptomyces sp. NPDC006476 TaxID=3157175 RepID=UPI0033A93420
MAQTRTAAILAALSLSLGITAVDAGSANAAAGDRHFVLISTHAAPLWRANAQLYAGRGNLVYSWVQNTRSGGRALWYFTDGGDGGSISVEVEGTNKVSLTKVPLDRDYCFSVSAGGDPNYTGDSITGGCNSD